MQKLHLADLQNSQKKLSCNLQSLSFSPIEMAVKKLMGCVTITQCHAK